MKMIDSHIHLDQYSDREIELIVKESHDIEALLSVSTNLESCKRNLELTKISQKIKAAFGFHPEQNLPTDEELDELIQWMHQYCSEMIAVGEVGLPYYVKTEQKLTSFQYNQYIKLLEKFIKLAKEWEKPIVLHAVYEDAPIVCELLEKYFVTKAHFHWFKGDHKTVERLIQNRYHISVTPEIIYKEKIQKLVQSYPLELLMVETDGPWPFEGPFAGKRTHPNMLESIIRMVAEIKNKSKAEVSERILENTKIFYGI